MQGNILLILKPEIFDHSISRENDDDIFLSGITIPSPDILLDQLFLDIVSVYRWPFQIDWNEYQIREQYNQPHHFLFEPGYLKNRVDTLVDIYDGKYAEFYIVETHDEHIPELLSLRKKEIRRKYLKNPNVAFYSLYHVSDSLTEWAREVAIYRDYIG